MNCEINDMDDKVMFAWTYIKVLVLSSLFYCSIVMQQCCRESKKQQFIRCLDQTS